MTVGHHWSLSRPMNDAERKNTEREGVCLACHQEIPTESLAVSFLHHVAAYADALPKTAGEHHDLVNKVLLFAAWGQAGGAVGGTLAALAAVGWLTVRWRRKRKPVGTKAPAEDKPNDEDLQPRG
jgi:hypothetical protein